MSMPSSNPEHDDTFVNVWFEENGSSDVHPNHRGHGKADFHGLWSEQSSAKASNGALTGAEFLLKLYPNHSLVSTSDTYRLNILNFPGATVEPLKDNPLITDVYFLPLPPNSSPIPGALVESIEFGAFKVTWQKYDFLVYMVTIPGGFGKAPNIYILHEGPEDPIRLLLLRVGIWAEERHNEIWVFNQGFWQKDAGLWRDVQKADWKDVILKDDFKKSLQKDVYGFFSSEELYKELGIPWKRGLIMHGPPGNGKTISLKVIMKTCDELGYAPLYVKSFQSYMGEEASMAAVFNKARQLSPSVIILEDLDSLINDNNRSFFLNQLDGLQGNDGLLVLVTTNHFDKLDPGLSTRPSRFDRKYLFDDPGRDERALYVLYWQDKLKNKDAIFFPDSLVDEVADATDRFSFAYLKEAFVSSLVTLAGYEDDEKPAFGTVLKDQIKSLRKQLNKDGFTSSLNSFDGISRRLPTPPSTKPSSSRNSTKSPTAASQSRDIRALIESMSKTMTNGISPTHNGTDPHSRNFVRATALAHSGGAEDGRDFRTLLDSVSNSMAGLNYDGSHPSRRNFNTPVPGSGSEYRQLLDRISHAQASTERGPALPGAWDAFSQSMTDPTSQGKNN